MSGVIKKKWSMSANDYGMAKTQKEQPVERRAKREGERPGLACRHLGADGVGQP